MNSLVNSLKFFRCVDLTDRLCWRRIGQAVLISWILFFIFEFIAMIGMWARIPILGSVELIVSVLVIVALITVIPGSMALIQRNIRKNLYTIPEAAALSAFTLSFVLGFGLSFGLLSLSYLMDGSSLFTCWYPSCEFYKEVLEPLFAGLIIGIFAFPVTIGLVFPFGICAGCALIVWVVVDEAGFISKKRWSIYVGISTLGWILLIIVGYVLGNA